MALQNQEIGARIAAMREARGNPPQEVVAQKLEVSNRSYQAWEAGETKPSWRNLTKLARFYDVTEEFILMGDVVEDESPAPTSGEPDQLALVLQKIEALQERIDANTERLERVDDRLDALDQSAGIKRMIRLNEEILGRLGRDIGRRALERRDDEDHREGPEADAA